jgi:hypothetical protein
LQIIFKFAIFQNKPVSYIWWENKKANRKIETPLQNCRTLTLQKLRITQNGTMIWQWKSKSVARFGTEESDGYRR